MTVAPVHDRAANMRPSYACLLYTSDAADDLLCVDLGGRRIIKKKQLLPNFLLTDHSHVCNSPATYVDLL